MDKGISSFNNTTKIPLLHYIYFTSLVNSGIEPLKPYQILLFKFHLINYIIIIFEITYKMAYKVNKINNIKTLLNF